jgi:hypothetical protein
MKRLLKTLICSITSIVLFIVTLLVLNVYIEIKDQSKDLGNGYVLYKYRLELLGGLYDVQLHDKDKKISINNIVRYRYDDDFIKIIHFPSEKFYCQNSESDVYISIWDLEYILIDKKSNKIYATSDKDKFENKCKEVGMFKEFFKNKQFMLSSPNTLPAVYRNSEYYKNLEQNCKKRYDYSDIIEYY